jgi:hypothetical protein
MAKLNSLRATIRVADCYSAEGFMREKNVCPFLAVKRGRAEATCYLGTTPLSHDDLPVNCLLREHGVEVVDLQARHGH